ncbi:MAG: glycine--tRNA ligase [Dehalococcoidia bacterium]|nr:glycine--tRNA ligase [Dehalococcoidia bacterium]
MDAAKPKPKVEMEKIVSLCKRRGFVFQSSEIYGGLASVWDYGPLGVEMKRNIRDAWWRANIRERDDMVGIEAGILMHPQVWIASGHVATFADPLVDCKGCRQRFRADQLTGEKCPNCGGELTEARMFNLMFKTFMGPVEEDASVVYMRPETAQGMFVNFSNVLNSTRKKLPFGIGQIGRSFRNEITPGNFIFRTREFEQMEIEYFVRPGTDEVLHERWIKERFNWYLSLGMKRENLRLRPHAVDELAHYAKACTDIEYLFPMGWSELEGIANRADYDLQQHSKFSGTNLTYFDEETNTHIFPYVIEPAGGVDRMLLAFLIDSYDEEPDKEGIRVVLRLHPLLAPVKVAILPLSRKEPLIAIAKDIQAQLRRHWPVQYDDAQSIGKRYRRQDEIGTPLCVTVDFETLNDNAVTVRDRDTMEQVRIPISGLSTLLAQRLGAV